MITNTPAIPLLIVIIAFSCLIAIIMRNKFSLLKFYLTVVSLVSVIGLAVGYGIGIYSVVEKVAITDAEYLASQRGYYGYDTCTEPKAIPSSSTGATEKPTEDQIKDCQTKREADMLMQRSVNMKEQIIGGLTWGTLALILFLIHYPLLLKKSREEHEEE